MPVEPIYLYFNSQSNSSKQQILTSINFLNPSSESVYSNNSEEKKNEEKSFLRFEPWKKSPKGFAVDVLFSSLTYIITYWFLHRIGILHMTGFNNHIRERIKNNYKSKESTNRELEKFEKTLKKSISLNPKASDSYWKNYYNRYVLDHAETKGFSSWKRLCAKVFKGMYSLTNGYGRLVYVSLVIFMSLLRAYAVNPHLSFFKALFISIGPIITQLIYRKYDAQTLKNVSANELQKLNDLGELSNFSFKWLSKALKRSENKLMFSVALIGSFFSRFVRDGVEGGLPANGKNGSSEYRNPVFRPFGKLPFVHEIRESSKIFKDGILDKYNHNEHHLAYLARIAGMKTALKYSTDYIVFGLGGVALLKIAYFLKHKFDHNHSHNHSHSFTQSLTNNFQQNNQNSNLNFVYI